MTAFFISDLTRLHQDERHVLEQKIQTMKLLISERFNKAFLDGNMPVANAMKELMGKMEEL